MKPLHSLSTIVQSLTFAALLGVSPAFAEDKPVAPKVLQNIDLAPATLVEVVDLLRAQSDEPILLATGLGEIRTPHIVMKNVTAGGVLSALDRLMPEIVVEQTAANDNSGQRVLNILPAEQAHAAPVRKITRIFKASANKLPNGGLKTLLDDITHAAELACITDAKVRNPQAKTLDMPVIEVHAPTGILVVAGEESKVELVGQVIVALGGELVPLTKAAAAATGEATMAAEQARIRELEQALQATRPAAPVPPAQPVKK